jgi:hypothetical protein
MKLVVQPEAETDIANAAVWYDEQATALRQKFLQTIEATFVVIEQHLVAIKESLVRSGASCYAAFPMGFSTSPMNSR